MQLRFEDLLLMEIPHWVVDPFGVNAIEVDISLQEYLIDLQSNMTAKTIFKIVKQNLWINSDIIEMFPQLCKQAELFVVAFPTSYLVECGFSRLSNMLSKARNRLDITKRGDLRLALTRLQPDIKKLVSRHQPRGSHSVINQL